MSTLEKSTFDYKRALETPWDEKLPVELVRAFKQVVPSVSNQDWAVGLPQFIVELRDARRFSQSLGYLRKSNKRLLPKKMTVGSASKALLKGGANAQLSWSFGVKPFVDDVVKLYQLHSQVEKFIDAWNRNVRMGRNVRAVRTVSHVTSEFPTETIIRDRTWKLVEAYQPTAQPELHRAPAYFYYPWYPPAGSYNLRNRITVVDVPPVVKLLFSVKPERINKTAQQVNPLYLDALGIGDVASATWDLVPFSFLVDYIVRIGDILESYDHQFSRLIYSRPICGFSYKTRRIYTSTVEHPLTGVTRSVLLDVDRYQRELLPVDMNIIPRLLNVEIPPVLAFQQRSYKTKLANAVSLLVSSKLGH